MDDFVQYDMINGGDTGGSGGGNRYNNNDGCGMIIVRIIFIGLLAFCGIAAPIELIVMLCVPDFAESVSFMGALVMVLFTIGDIVFLVWLIKNKYKNSK